MIPRHLIIAVTVMFVIALITGAYVWHMRGSLANPIPGAAEMHPPAPPSNGPTEQVTLYVAHDETGSLRPQSAQMPISGGRQERAEQLVRTLLQLYLSASSTHPLAQGADLRAAYLVDPDLAVIDVNAAFAEKHRSGILVEELTVASLVETLSANIRGINRVKILVEGKERESLAGHADLARFYDVAGVDRMISQMQTGQ
jgi:Sporulation and spore germination